MRLHFSLFVRASLGLVCLASAARADQFYAQANLVSDVPGLAPVLDPNLKNPWGMSSGMGNPATPFWVSDQVTGVATLYNGAGAITPLVVPIPGGGPTGQLFNHTTDFALANNNPALFLFSTLGGTIVGWNGVGTQQVAATVGGAVFTGLTMANNGSGNMLFAADTAGGKIDVFNGTFQQVTPSGNFVDPDLKAGLSPYNVQAIGNSIYVTYENRGVVAGAVAQFDLNGNFIRQLGDASTPFDSPWGVVLAPSGFGQFGGDLLVGNKDGGYIDVFDPNTGAFLGQLKDANGNVIIISGLWGLEFGNGGPATDPNTLYFVAGINNEADGLFGRPAAPEPSTIALFAVGGLGVVGFRRRLIAVARLRERTSMDRSRGPSPHRRRPPTFPGPVCSLHRGRATGPRTDGAVVAYRR